MANQKYSPGSRNPKYRFDGKMSDSRVTWMRTILGASVIMFYEPGFDEEDDEQGPTVRLILPRPYGKATTLNITALTAPELKMMREFYNLLFDLAEPSILERDRVAQDAFESGDDSFARTYRQPPQFVLRSSMISDDYKEARRMLDELAEKIKD